MAWWWPRPKSCASSPTSKKSRRRRPPDASPPDPSPADASPPDPSRDREGAVFPECESVFHETVHLAMPIHPTAIVDPRARIAETADIGPYCIVGAEVEIGARTRLMANLYLEGPTRTGEDTVFFPFSSVGVASQDLKYKGERAETRIGHRNRIREFVTIHRGTQAGGLVTSIGSDNLLMTYTHVAHDCRIGDHVILGN